MAFITLPDHRAVVQC